MILECENPSSRMIKHNKFPGTQEMVGGKMTLGTVYWRLTCANLAENKGLQGITYLLPTVWQSSLPSPADSLPGTRSSLHPLGWS